MVPKDHSIPETDFAKVTLIIPLLALNRSAKVLKTQFEAAMGDPGSPLFKALVELGALPRAGWTGAASATTNTYGIGYVVRELRRREKEAGKKK